MENMEKMLTQMADDIVTSMGIESALKLSNIIQKIAIKHRIHELAEYTNDELLLAKFKREHPDYQDEKLIDEIEALCKEDIAKKERELYVIHWLKNHNITFEDVKKYLQIKK